MLGLQILPLWQSSRHRDRRSMQSGIYKSLLQYGTAVVAVAAAFLVRLALGRSWGDAVAFSMLCGAVSFIVWFGGYRPALLCVGLAFLAAPLVEMRDGALFGNTGRMVAVGLYLLSCIIIIVFAEATHIARRRLEAAQAAER